MEKIILASSSPRRKELLEQAEIPFDICIKNIDETVPEGLSPAQGAEYTAQKKAKAITPFDENTVVLGADTVVVLEGQIIGKPKDKQDAIRMLTLLSGKEHKVITGVCLIKGKKVKTFHSISRVKFYELTEEQIKRYVASGEPTDKAGAYGIQGKGSVLIEEIHGDYFNIVGLPIARVVREIAALQEEE